MYKTFGKIYKSQAINLDFDNKVEIAVMEEAMVPPLEEDDEMPEMLDAPDIEALTADAEEKAQEIAKTIVDAAKNEAGTIIGQARMEAEGIIKDARRTAEQDSALMLMDAEKKGYEEGHQKGISTAQTIVDEAEALKTETLTEREAAIKALEPELINLVIRISRKLVSDTARINPDVVLHLIRQGLSQSSFTGDLTLRVSKDDYDNVVSNKEQLMEYLEGGAQFDIVKDFGLGIGDCVIETPFGVIDSSLDMQFEEIGDNLRLILEGNLEDTAV